MNILFFDQPGSDDTTLCGGKGASLGRLAATGAVPPGFNLTVNAFGRWTEVGSTEIPADLESTFRLSPCALRTCLTSEPSDTSDSASAETLEAGLAFEFDIRFP